MTVTRVDLAAYAVHEGQGRGRLHAEPSATGDYQRDRERIIHSAAFRRLEYKTQVFVNHEGDLFRTRLTHTIEVAQIARTIARSLALNEDLAEAIALAHDLGHTPFGHAGQEALNACMEPFGGFEHNRQSLRVVEELEERFAGFDGLNLTFETREGVLKHCSRAEAERLGDVGRRFLDGTQPALEAQLTNLADEIAYNAHDIDDGLRSGLIDEQALGEVELFASTWARARRSHPDLPRRRTVHVVVRELIEAQVADLCEHSRALLAAAAPADVEAVRAHPVRLIGFSDAMQSHHRQIKVYLRQHLYRHYRVHRMAMKSRRVVDELFSLFMSDPGLLPAETAEKVAAQEKADGTPGRARGVADYIAGMTDRYAFAEHERLYLPRRLT
jgi:dGTPase